MLERILGDADVQKWKKHARLATAGEALPEAAKVTDEGIARRRSRANKPYIPRNIYFNSEATRDGIRHFVDGIGDQNPLFRDEEYAKKSKYGAISAPGCYLYTIHWVSEGSGMPGVHAWYSGGDWEWYRPVLEGDRFKAVIIIRDLVIKKGRMVGGGNLYIDYTEIAYVNQRGEIAGKELLHAVWAEREASETAGKYRDESKIVYTKEDWARILEAYDREQIRGKTPRWWEDVEVGEKLDPMIKGPLSVRDMLAWIMGAGSIYFRAHKTEFDYETRHPGALEYVKETGEADVPELVHIFDHFAHAIGIERAYDYGHQRMSWLGNFFTNWMGDDGFLSKMNGDLRVFNQVGDVTIFEGKVVKKYVEDGKCCVDIEAWAKNQKDEWSMPPGLSTVILPSRQYGPVVYPDPPASLVEDVKRARPLEEMIREGLI